MTNDKRTAETLVDEYLKLEYSCKEIEDKIDDDTIQNIIVEKQNAIVQLKLEIAKYTEDYERDMNELKEKQTAILDELKTRYDGADKEIPTGAGTVHYRITKKTIIHDAGKVAMVLLKNDKDDAIKSFDMKTVRSFIDVGLLDDIAGFEENVNVRILPLSEG